ncbi:c-type cytochrome [Parasulfuritortus cantonensis]|uniref:C-type cytochrome n=1 Tax=Parasulfuritortus cantonensis TaxID=2528202 RepID=A0A4R1BD49_9PROT|nr:cytochrome c peroxidase [Parasulfuritortus cantonensis]TCJ14973.1 c-type cytochrome [Parasulfuritortus cantonensis]
MYPEWLDFLGLLALLALLGALAVLAIVLRELAPSAGLSGRGRFLLAAGLGMGVLAFAAKATAITLMVTLPQATLAPLSAVHHAGRAPGRTPPATPAAVPVKAVYAWRPLPDTAAPADAVGPARVALGERLFHDKALSRDYSVACASCHDVAGGTGADGRATSLGIAGQVGRRNAPTVWNAAFQARLFLDGRAPSLEEQAKGPPVNPVEMGMHSLAEVAARVAARPDYRAAFAAAFGPAQAVDIDAVVAAIAAYERTLVTADAPYDRYVRGDRAALDAAQVRGMALFEEVGCVICHHGPNFSSASRFDARAPYRMFPAYGNAYVARYRLADDHGLGAERAGRGVWKVPSLRNVALTGPYFHNGAVTSLEEAVRIMATSQLGRRVVPGAADPAEAAYWSAADRALHRVPGRELSEAQVRDIAAFLRALSSARLAARVAASGG